MWAGHWRISVGGPPTRQKSKDLKKSLTVEPDELPFPKRPAENKFKTTEKQKLDFIFFPAPLYFLFRRGGTGGACWCWCWVDIDLGGDFGVGVGDLAIYKKKGSHKLH